MTTLIALVESVLIVLSTVVLVLRRLFGKGRKRKDRKPLQWRVATRKAYHEVDAAFGAKAVVPWPGHLAVLVVRGDEAHSMGAAEIKAENFDAEIARLTVLAEERASSLNALDVYA